MFTDTNSKQIEAFNSACERFAANYVTSDLAKAAGMQPQMLRNKLNPDQPHQLTAAELVAHALNASLDRQTAIVTALSGGDDYELCFTVPPEREAQLETVAAMWACRCTWIGVIEADPGLRLVRADGSAFHLERQGYDHFG